MDLDADVLVVGAGPAGSLAAKHAALGGARTLLIEKRQEIGTPVRCGEGVGRAWLEEAGIPPDRSFIAHEIRASRVVAPDGTSFVAEDVAGMKGGYIVERDLFDRFLARAAAKAGADILIKTTATALLREDGRVTGARCDHMGETFDVRAGVVIGADGFESQVGRWAGLTTHLRSRDILSCLQYTLVGVDIEPEYGDFYVGSVAPGGYAWVFPKAEDAANVGLGVPLSRVQDLAATKGYLDRFVERTPAFAKGSMIEAVAGGVSASLPVERSVAPGLLLAGDAARLIDPLTGAGIRNALLTGRWAGETAARIAADPATMDAALQDYERRWRARLDEELAQHYLVKEAFQKLDDAALNAIVRAIADARLERFTAAGILDVLRARCPEILAPFRGLL